MGHSKLGRRCWELSPSLSQSHPPTSVTRLADLFLDFVQLFRAFGDNYFPKSPTFLGNFCNGVKIYHFSREIILGNFYRHLVIFFQSHCPPPNPYPHSLWWHFRRCIKASSSYLQTINNLSLSPHSLSSKYKLSHSHSLLLPVCISFTGLLAWQNLRPLYVP